MWDWRREEAVSREEESVERESVSRSWARGGGSEGDEDMVEVDAMDVEVDIVRIEKSC